MSKERWWTAAGSIVALLLVALSVRLFCSDGLSSERGNLSLAGDWSYSIPDWSREGRITLSVLAYDPQQPDTWAYTVTGNLSLGGQSTVTRISFRERSGEPFAFKAESSDGVSSDFAVISAAADEIVVESRDGHSIRLTLSRLPRATVSYETVREWIAYYRAL